MSKRPESLKKDKLEHQKKDISSQEDESKEKFASNLKKPEKRKDLKEGIEVKDDGVYFDVFYT